MPMTPEAKKALATTIRALRDRLLADLHDATEARYRLGAKADVAGLAAGPATRRARFEAWIDEQVRAQPAATKAKPARTAAEFRREAEKLAAATLLNRLVMLRLLEAPAADGSAPMRAPAVLTGGWQSRAYLDFRALAPALCGDETEGYELLLRLVFEDLALELPGVFGPAGVAELVPVPAATLRAVVEALDAPALQSCWTDDMTLGWVYQYWNDPEREALDAKIAARQKIEPHEIASKTQLFTERYMVDWLLQNTLGPMWLQLCTRHGWTAEVQRPGPDGRSLLQRLDARRAEFRAKREAGEVALTALMPLYDDAERRWAYFLEQPALPVDADGKASVREWRIVDPACGSGHFLVVAFDLLFALYEEEARQRGEVDAPRWQPAAIAEQILERNLHGLDLDPRAVQIAAAALWLKAKQRCRDAAPAKLNLVATQLRLTGMAQDDPALLELQASVERETGVPAALTATILTALRGADHLGSLLRIDKAVDAAIAETGSALGRARPTNLDLFRATPEQLRLRVDAEAAKATLVGQLERFLAAHTRGDDLGLRLRGEQLAAGVRMLRLLREGSYDLVVANPPYQGTSKIAESRYVEAQYPLGKADLYAAFLLRGLELVREGGLSAMLTMRNWMFLKQYAGLRKDLLESHTLTALCDLSWGAFEEMRDNPVAIACFARGNQPNESVAVAPTDPQERVRTHEELQRKESGLLCHVGRQAFVPAALKVVPEWPLVYWWTQTKLAWFSGRPLFGNSAPARQGLITGDMTRFLREPHEIHSIGHWIPFDSKWTPYILGAKGKSWIDPICSVVNWQHDGCEVEHLEKNGRQASRPQNRRYYHRVGVAFSMIGSSFSARVHRSAGIFGGKGSSIFPGRPGPAVCALNSSRSKELLASLNPGVGFEVGDVNRLPLFPIANADDIYATLETAFTRHESHREPSVEYHHPGPSPWRHAQDWAQLAVDRPDDTPLPPYDEVLDPEPATDHLSYALGVALGRFAADGTGILDPATADLSTALPAGLLFLDNSLDDADLRDSLGHPAAASLHAAWATHGPEIHAKRSLRAWLTHDFFKSVHLKMYENRPIHWPLSSANKTFVCWLQIHRMDARTLHTALADHLHPTLHRLDGELADLRATRDGADKGAASRAERELDRKRAARDELAAFIALVAQCADAGPPPVDGRCPARERDARYDPDLDDGVLINSAALWPLLEPQWKEPKKWWRELAESKASKDYDWAHLAMRYWPTRVDGKCRQDPSLGVAHGCFWRYHPARAWAWELRLQDELGLQAHGTWPGRIEEAPYAPDGLRLGIGTNPGPDPDPGDAAHRAAWLRDHAEEALAAVEKEAIRRMGRGDKRKLVETMTLLEPGLWSALPAEVWAMELKLAEKQGKEFRLLAPDEAQARAAFEAASPGLVAERAVLLSSLVPLVLALGDGADAEDDDGPDGGDDAPAGDEED